LSFHLGQGFHVLGVVSGYLRHDPESLGYAVVIEWLNPESTLPEHSAASRCSTPEGGGSRASSDAALVAHGRRATSAVPRPGCSCSAACRKR
jgi:hypothetical protein